MIVASMVVWSSVALRLVTALLPVCLFLLALVYLDSYKLVRVKLIAALIAAGALAAIASWGVNTLIIRNTDMDIRLLRMLTAPLVEEILKAVPVLLLLRARRIGFLVDAAIVGFAVGTGFAVFENVYYFQQLQDAPFGLWLVRGFGTAMMHGGSTAVVATISKSVSTRAGSKVLFAAPGLLVAYLLHAGFNSFFIPPIASALIVLGSFPILLILVFGQSEGVLRAWLGSGFDLHSELIETLNSGQFTSSPAGQYLQSLREHFDGPMMADMVCILRMHAELSLRAKGILMMREAGFPVKRDAEINEKLEELHYLEKSIGRTGALAIDPILQTTAQDIWQLRMLEEA